MRRVGGLSPASSATRETNCRLGHELAVGQVEHFTDGRGAFGGEEDSFDQVFNIDTVEHLLAGAEVGERARA